MPRRSVTPEYSSWLAMRVRCLNPNHEAYDRYGGRGITVCDRWSTFANFLADVGPRPSLKYSIDRYPNNNGNYEPGNVRWATRDQQNNNRRDNVNLTISGKTMTLSQWSRESGISISRLWGRVQSGWDETRLLEPLKWVRPSSEFGHNWSGFRGVYKNAKKNGKPFKAQIKVAGKSKHLGYFDDPNEASRVVEKAIEQLRTHALDRVLR